MEVLQPPERCVVVRVTRAEFKDLRSRFAIILPGKNRRYFGLIDGRWLLLVVDEGEEESQDG